MKVESSQQVKETNGPTGQRANRLTGQRAHGPTDSRAHGPTDQRAPGPTTFGLMRHAETEWNRVKRIQGHLDSRLTDEGRERALRWGRCLGSESWDRILASDLGRAVSTAREVNRALGLSVATDDRLREQDWGEWSGRTVPDLVQEIPDLMERYGSAGWAFCPPGGETRAAVCERGREALCAAAARWPGQRILVVAHAGMIRILINGLLGRAFLPDEPQILLSGHLHRLVVDQSGLRADQLNAVDLNNPTDPGDPASASAAPQEADFITMDNK